MASLKEYLKRYETAGQEQRKKKRKKIAKPAAPGGVLIVDEDPVWAKPVVPDAEEESEAEETPVIDEDVEVKRMRRLQELRARKPYHSISEDGSGWVTISNSAKGSSAGGEAPDLSPPRHRRSRFDTPSPERSNAKHLKSDPDARPSTSRGDSPDFSPPRRRASSPRDEDLSPPRRRSRVAEADFSPPRRRGTSPLGDDLSPPRRRKKGADEDLSPPRRTARPTEAVDLSPPRRRNSSPPVDLSPPRRERNVTSGDLSPPRREKGQRKDLSPRRQDTKKKQPSTKEERRAGLFTGREIKEEIDRKKKDEISRFSALDPSLSGRDAEPVYRDKEGKRISKEEKMKTQKVEEKPKEKKLEWGKGLVQKREAEARISELELEKEKPFARSRDDPELDKMLRERTRWGDPMAHLVKKKELSELVLEDLGEDEKMKESGFIIPQGIPTHSWLKRGVDPPVNRYGIRPGRHWDGVDRSNGFEKQMFQRQNERRATESEAYLWSVSDM